MQENQNTGKMETQHLGSVEFQNPNPAPNAGQYQQRRPQQRPQNGQRPPQRRRKNNKKLAMQRMGIVIGVILAIFLIIFSMGASWGKGRGTKLTNENVIECLKPVAKISETNYHYTNIAKFENVDDFYGFDASDYSNLTISYEGVVTASIDVSKIKVDVKKDVVTITLPEPTIKENKVTENSVAVYNANRGTFENITLTDFKGFEKTQQPVAQSGATTNGLLFNTSDKAKAAVKPLVEALAGARKDKYKITVN